MLLRIALIGAVALAAFLVISVQPAVAVALLPVTGSNPYVWHAVQAVFQALLLCGYGVAAWISRPGAARFKLYGLFLVAGPASLLLMLSSDRAAFEELAESRFRALGVLVAPFVALSTFSITAQMILAAKTGETRPVWLYAASNAGSLCAVFAYPFLIERYIRVGSQLWLWSLASGVLLLASVAVGSYLGVPRHVQGLASGGAERARLEHLAKWMVGGLCPVGLSLACTSYLAIDSGSHPVVWLGPFSIYLSTLVLAFSGMGQRVVEAASRLAPGAIVVTCAALLTGIHSMGAYVLYLSGLAVILLAWQVWVVKQRPTVSLLPTYYICLAAGGVIGSLIAGFGAPLLLDPVHFGSPNGLLHRSIFGSMAPEYLAFLAATCGILKAERRSGRGRASATALLNGAAWGAACLLAVPIVLRILTAGPGAVSNHMGWAKALVAAVALAGAAGLLRLRLETAVAIVAVIVADLVQSVPTDRVLMRTRSLYSHLAVVEEGMYRRLYHGTTVHGSQLAACTEDPGDARCHHPTTYYERQGPVGLLVASQRGPTGRALDIGVVGLGVGTMSAYCQPGDTILFAEIDDRVVAVAERYFGFVAIARQRCTQSRIVSGDARLVFRKQPSGTFDLLVADAFSSDSIPAHLLTLEAIQEFARTLKADGAIAFHLSNRYYDLVPMLTATSLRAGLSSVIMTDAGSPNRSASVWVWASPGSSGATAVQRALASPDNEHLLERSVTKQGPVWMDGQHSLLAIARH
jgi:predicted O-methyltransferase YrrM